MGSKLIEVFKNIEGKFDVVDWRLLGIDVWPIIRKEIFYSKVPSKAKKSNNSKSPRFMDLTEFSNERETVDVLFLFDTIRLVEEKNQLVNRISGPISRNFKKLGYSVGNIQYSINDSEKLLNDLDSCFIDNSLIKKAYSILYQINKLPNYIEVAQYFNDNINGEYVFPSLVEIIDKLSLIKYLSDIFEKTLIKLKTKYVFIEIYHHHITFAICVASRRLGIPVFEVQHGVLTDELWLDWGSVKRNGYNTLPNIFLTWNEIIENKINTWARETKTHTAICIGNLWIKEWKMDNLFSINNTNKSNRKNILFTLQPLFGLPDWESNIPNWVLEVMKKSPKEWKWYIRYHPLMFGSYLYELEDCEEKLVELKKSGKVETDLANKKLILELFTNTDLHITPFSASTIEAIHMNVPTICLHHNSERIKDYDINNKYLFTAYDQDTLVSEMYRLLNKIDKKFNDIYNEEDISVTLDKLLKSEKIQALVLFLQNTKHTDFNKSDSKFFEIEKILEKENEDSLNKEIEFQFQLDYNLLIYRLFKMSEFKKIVERAPFLEISIDNVFYIGRSFEVLGKYNQAIEYLDIFIKLYEKCNFNKYLVRTYKENFLLSAHYYIAISYYNIGEKEKARFHFTNCLKISNNRHKYATEYLKLLS